MENPQTTLCQGFSMQVPKLCVYNEKIICTHLYGLKFVLPKTVFEYIFEFAFMILKENLLLLLSIYFDRHPGS